MKKFISFVILFSILASSASAHSKSVVETDPGFVILDVLFYRPAGLAVTIIGTGLFVGMSPLTALASIPAPHDAFARTGEILVVAPSTFTFVRPLGERNVFYNSPLKTGTGISTSDTLNR
jgi:hypothetical protein